MNSKGKALPGSVRNAFGEGKIEKGRWGRGENSVYMVAWDFVEECTHEDCPLHGICHYVDSFYMRGNGVNGGSNKCLMQQRYLKNVLHAVMDKIGDKKGEMNQENVIKLGYHLMPMYAQLFKFKCFEYTKPKLVYTTEKGTPKVHPVYKEIREIIKTLSGLWRDIGGDPKKRPDMGKIGDASFIDAMFEEENNNPIGEEESAKGTGLDYSEFEENEGSESGMGIDHEDDTGKPKKKSQKRGYKRRKKQYQRKRGRKPNKAQPVPGPKARSMQRKAEQENKE